MKKETWKYIALLNMLILSFLGMGILQYFKCNHFDWYNSHVILGSTVLILGIAGWLTLVVQSSFYFHKKSRSKKMEAKPMDVMDKIENAKNLAFKKGWDEMIDCLQEIQEDLEENGY